MDRSRLCKCNRCRNVHMLSERVEKSLSDNIFDFVCTCPRCGAHKFYLIEDKDHADQKTHS